MYQTGRKLSFAKAAFALSFVLLLLALSFRARSAADRPFQITSIGTAFGVQGEFLGSYRIEDDDINVHITKASLLVREDCPYQGRREILEVSFGLASESPNGKWRVQTMAQPITLHVVMRPGDTRVFNGLDYRIPLRANTDLRKHWFVVAIKEEILDPPRNVPSPLRGTNFAHSCKNIFAPNFDSFRRQPNVPASGAPRNCP